MWKEIQHHPFLNVAQTRTIGRKLAGGYAQP
jgi:hypothetical protein